MEHLSAHAAGSQLPPADGLPCEAGVSIGKGIELEIDKSGVVDSDDDLGDPEPVTQPPAFFAPLIRSIRSSLPESVYPPSDDTFLVLQTILDDLYDLRDRRLVRACALCLFVCFSYVHF